VLRLSEDIGRCSLLDAYSTGHKDGLELSNIRCGFIFC